MKWRKSRSCCGLGKFIECVRGQHTGGAQFYCIFAVLRTSFFHAAKRAFSTFKLAPLGGEPPEAPLDEQMFALDIFENTYGAPGSTESQNPPSCKKEIPKTLKSSSIPKSTRYFPKSKRYLPQSKRYLPQSKR